MIPRIRRRLLRGLLRLQMLICVFFCLYDRAFGLVPELCRQFAVPAEDLVLRLNLFLVPRPMCCDLSGACALSSSLLQMSLNLLSPWTRCVQVLLRVSPNLRLTVFARLDLIAKLLQPQGKFGTV